MTNEKESMIEYKDLELPNYINLKHVFANLTVSDLVIAAVLGGMNVLFVGGPRTGKTQLALAKDIYDYYFNGNKKENGHGVFIRAHPEIDICNEIFTQLNIKKADRELTNNIDALIYVVDGLHMAPPVVQNQVLCLGDGIIYYKGKEIRLGKDGYRLLIATANLDNSEFQGTFDTYKDLYSRVHLVIDFDDSAFTPTFEDKFSPDSYKTNPNVKKVPKRDISTRIIEANKEISKISKKLSLEEIVVLNYLRFGLNNCQKNITKDKGWPWGCQECNYNYNKNNDSLCSLIKAPNERTLNVIKKYASALYYLAKLKDPNVTIDTIDLMFKAFELTGAYQSLLNSQILKNDFFGQNLKMMTPVVERLKYVFEDNVDYIIASLIEAGKGKELTTFFEENDKLGNYNDLDPHLKKIYDPISPFSNNTGSGIGFGWVRQALIERILKSKKENKLSKIKSSKKK